ncbi:MAG: hypothetical protein J6X82_06830, partial [Bacteroidales bacterium]|nr:hypothetical protein [Bacteroidales bacterium]
LLSFDVSVRPEALLTQNFGFCALSACLEAVLTQNSGFCALLACLEAVLTQNSGFCARWSGVNHISKGNRQA